MVDNGLQGLVRVRPPPPKKKGPVSQYVHQVTVCPPSFGLGGLSRDSAVHNGFVF